jgi:hypothetical protein
MACFESRTRIGDGRIEKRNGESMTLVSPSSPISIGASDVTSTVGVAHDESPRDALVASRRSESRAS